jgi:hypothetical protein
MLLTFTEIYSRLLDSMIPTMKSDEALEYLAARATNLRVSLRQTPHVQGEVQRIEKERSRCPFDKRHVI